MIIFIILTLCGSLSAPAQQLDSLIDKREAEFQAYSLFKENMKERTWLNLVELGNKATTVIERDNQLLKVYRNAESNKLDELEHEINRLNLEISYLAGEAGKQETQIAKYQQMNAILLIVLAGLVLVSIISLTLLIIRTNQYKQNQIELERFWSMKDEYSIAHKEKENELLRQIRLLEIEQKAMQKEFILMSDQRTEARKRLEEEISNRRKVEEEIKELLGQLKTK